MAENPLLPDNQLRALLELAKECARLDAATARSVANPVKSRGHIKRGATWPSREALIAGTLLHLQPGDVLLPSSSDAVSVRLAPRLASDGLASPLLPAAVEADLGGKAPRLLLGAAMAAAMRAGGSDRLVMVHLDPSSAQANWSAALHWAQQSLLPLIVVCGDGRGRGAFQPDSRHAESTPNWDSVQLAASRFQLPVLCVDGEDAVAVYRVAQESVLRARSGAGPALLWAMLPSARELAAGRSPAARPVARLQRYLRSRKISTQAA